MHPDVCKRTRVSASARSQVMDRAFYIVSATRGAIAPACWYPAVPRESGRGEGRFFATSVAPDRRRLSDDDGPGMRNLAVLNAA